MMYNEIYIQKMGEKFKITANIKFQVLLHTSYNSLCSVLITAPKNPQVMS